MSTVKPGENIHLTCSHCPVCAKAVERDRTLHRRRALRAMTSQRFGFGSTSSYLKHTGTTYKQKEAPIVKHNQQVLHGRPRRRVPQDRTRTQYLHWMSQQARENTLTGPTSSQNYKAAWRTYHKCSRETLNTPRGRVESMQRAMSGHDIGALVKAHTLRQ